jgi:hypothetical protein
MSVNDSVVLRVNEDNTLKVYNDCLLKLWNEHVKTNDNLKDSQKETFKSRLSTMFNKCILNTYVMNYSYSEGKQFPLTKTDLSEEDIMRGYHVYNYYLSQMVCIFDSTPKSDLTKTEQEIIEMLEIGKPTDRNGLKVEVLKRNIGSESTFKRLMSKKSKQFTVAYNRFGNKHEIIRNF